MLGAQAEEVVAQEGGPEMAAGVVGGGYWGANAGGILSTLSTIYVQILVSL